MTYLPNIIKDSQTGRSAAISSFAGLKVTDPTFLVMYTFEQATLDTTQWTSTLAGTGSNAQTGGQVVLETGATANSSAKISGNRLCHYVPGSTNIFGGSFKFGDTGTANNVRRFGMYDANNGAFFQLNGTTFGIGVRKAGVDTIKTSAFSGTAPTIDTNYHVWYFEFSDLQINFYQDFVLIHTVNAGPASICANLHLPVTIENTNSGGATADVTLDSMAISVFRAGKPRGLSVPDNVHITTNATTTVKMGPGTLHRMIIGTKGGAAATVTIYDSLSGSGTVIGVLDIVNTIGSVEYNINFDIGLTLVTANIGGGDITVAFS